MSGYPSSTLARAVFGWPTARDHRPYQLLVTIVSIGPDLIVGRFQTDPIFPGDWRDIQFRRSDGVQLCTERDGSLREGGWRLDPHALHPRLVDGLVDN